MTSVYLLQHARPSPNGHEEVKLIGIYSSRQRAEAAIERLRSQPGFAGIPDGFTLDEYDLDRDHWAEGFVTLD